jgi:hypothetical protein
MAGQLHLHCMWICFIYINFLGETRKPENRQHTERNVKKKKKLQLNANQSGKKFDSNGI